MYTPLTFGFRERPSLTPPPSMCRSTTTDRLLVKGLACTGRALESKVRVILPAARRYPTSECLAWNLGRLRAEPFLRSWYRSKRLGCYLLRDCSLTGIGRGVEHETSPGVSGVKRVVVHHSCQPPVHTTASIKKYQRAPNTYKVCCNNVVRIKKGPVGCLAPKRVI